VQQSVDKERLGEYQKRVSSWISEQGMFFQLRYSGIVADSSFIKQIWNFLIKLLILFAALLGFSYVVLNRHFDSASYSERIGEKIGEALRAEVIEVSSFSRARGQGQFRDVELTGGDYSFFIEANMDSLSGPITFLAGVTEDWAPEEIRINEGSFQLKAGGEDEEMEEAFAVVIDTFSGSKLQSIIIEHLDFDWGYTKLTYGAITDTRFIANNVDGAWEISLSGGRFTQNWLKDLELVSASIVCGADGITIESMDLKLGEGSMSFTGGIRGTLAMPEFQIAGEFVSLPIDRLISLAGIQTREFISGAISGDLNIEGSSNRKILTHGNARIKEGDIITIREKWAILRMLSVLDLNNSFRRVDFNTGSFNFSSGDGGLELSDIVLQSTDQLRLEGELSARLPTQKEAAEALGITLSKGFGKGLANDPTDVSGANALEEERWSLKRAANGGKVNDLDLDFAGLETTNEGLNVQLSQQEVEEKRLRGAMSVHRVEGDLKLGVYAGVFSEYASLQEKYPSDNENWRWIPLGVDTTFSKISEEEAEQLKLESRANRIKPIE
jgi:hypothetical protein